MDLIKTSEREDPRVLRTRHLLLQAFYDLFLEKGFQAMTVQDIAERASVNRGTFYTHFEDKYAILEYWLREQFRQQVVRMMPMGRPWNVDTMRFLIQRVAEWFLQLHQEVREAGHETKASERAIIPLVATTLQEELFELLLRELQPITAAGMNGRASLETMAMVMSWAIFGSGFQCFHQGDEPPVVMPADELANEVESVLTRGLAQMLPAFGLDK
jgi:AcrR family transcriptional regulator